MLRRAGGRAIIINRYPAIRRYFEDSKLINEMSDKEFYEWFVGFCDAESNFGITITKDSEKVNSISRIRFNFRIELHCLDIEVLQIIRNKLGFGEVHPSKTRNLARFGVSDMQVMIDKLIPIFDQYNLNSTKFLDYLVFKEVLFLYKNKNKTLNKDETDHIFKLCSNLNDKRKDFNMPNNHKIKITPSWLVGFIEGEGTFTIRSPRNNTVSAEFSLELTESQKPLLDAIKVFIDSLSFNAANPDLYLSRCSICYKKARNNAKPTFVLIISDLYFLYMFFVPMLNSQVFLAKKKLDFRD